MKLIPFIVPKNPFCSSAQTCKYTRIGSLWVSLRFSVCCTSSPEEKPSSRIRMEPSSSLSDTIPVFSTLGCRPEGEPNDVNSRDSTKKPISLWPGMYHSPMTVALWETRSSLFERILDPPLDAPPQRELLTRTPSQSRMSILYNFSSDYVLREQYRDPWNEIRIGKLLEDLDALAGTISFKHCSDDDSTTRPLYLVTASVDKMVLKKPISVDVDLHISGAVTWVGHTSIAIQLDVTQPGNEITDNTDSVALTANFIFVARDYKTGKAAPVNRINPETEREISLYEAAEARNNLRKRKTREDKGESDNGRVGVDKVEKLLADGRIFCDMPALADRDSILLKDTRLENSLICQPQQRNIHGRIFGGFLMHRAFELAFSTVYVFAGMMPYFLEVDSVHFLRPVDVGDFLRLKSCVLYTESENLDKPLIHVEVVAHVTRPEFKSSEVSNRFYFTFTVRPEAKAMHNGHLIRKVVPATEEEAQRIVERMDADLF